MQNRRLIFLINNFTTIEVDRCKKLQWAKHWQMVLLFKWIKQHVPINTISGASDTALKKHRWIVLSANIGQL